MKLTQITRIPKEVPEEKEEDKTPLSRIDYHYILAIRTGAFMPSVITLKGVKHQNIVVVNEVLIVSNRALSIGDLVKPQDGNRWKVCGKIKTRIKKNEYN